MKTSRKTRLISLLLAAVMLVIMIPFTEVAAFAASEDHEHRYTDDGDSTTPIYCVECGAEIIPAEDSHSHIFDFECYDADGMCNNEGCEVDFSDYAIAHDAADDDGDCTTPICCVECGVIVCNGLEHEFTDNYDSSCNNEGCNFVRITEHIPEEDDGDCTTEVICEICGIQITPAEDRHIFDFECDDADGMCNNEGCEVRFDYATVHDAADDDGDCTTPICCVECGVIVCNGLEHEFTDNYDSSCNNEGCNFVRITEHIPEEDDGDCTTEVICEICGIQITPAEDSHIFDFECYDADGMCNNEGCEVYFSDYIAAHDAADDDSDCTTPICCVECGEILLYGLEHEFDNNCDSSCNNRGCDFVRITEHIPEEDDGDCTTPVSCTDCGAIVIEAEFEHVFRDNCSALRCYNYGCDYMRDPEDLEDHTPEEDDGDCTTTVFCTVCGVVVVAAKVHTYSDACDPVCDNAGCLETRVTTHVPATDDGDCTTMVICENCGEVVIMAQDAHIFDNEYDLTCNNEGCEYIREGTSSAELIFGNGRGQRGETVTIDIRLEKAPDIKSMAFYNFIYDETKLELVDVEWKIEAAYTDWNEEDGNAVMIYDENTSSNTVIITLTFKILDDCPHGKYEVSARAEMKQNIGVEGDVLVPVDIISGIIKVGYLYGDVNLDGEVNTDDVNYLIWYTYDPANYPVEDPIENADFDHSGVIDSNDALYLLYHLFFEEDYPLIP